MLKDKSKKQSVEVSTRRIHFMGIGGSGISAVAALANKWGYTVTGCDELEKTPYLDKVRSLGIKVFKGHNVNHLNESDLLVISPAIVYQNKNNIEYKKALSEKKVIVWNKFVGDRLLEGKNVVAVSGTHGKGTTTAMLSLILEDAQKDPNVLIGATVPKWKSNYRIGNSDIFVIESDEFYEKFLDYKPSTILINNIEFDHPDYFRDEEHLLSCFVKFVKLLRGDKNLIVNLDSEGVQKLLRKITNIHGINIYGYTFNPKNPLGIKNTINCSIISKVPEGTTFSVYSKNPPIDSIYRLILPGEYNVSNALGVIIAAKIMGVDDRMIHEALVKFSGLGRRFEKVFEKNDVTVYDDYAHHPTAIKKTLEALRQKYPTRRIICIDEPHSYSRTKALLKMYRGVFGFADKVLIGPIFKARDSKTFGVSGYSVVSKSNHKDIKYLNSIDKIIKHLKNEVKKNDVIITMGAGESYLWTEKIVNSINKLKL